MCVAAVAKTLSAALANVLSRQDGASLEVSDGGARRTLKMFRSCAGAGGARKGTAAPGFRLGVIVEKEQRRINKSARWTSREEEKVWVGFYRRVADPAVAADLIEQMEADREVKARHLGLYLRCRQSLRQDKVRRARARAVASMSQAIVHVACIRPLSVLGALWHFVGDVVNAWLMPSDEPAVRQMRKIQRSPPVPKEEASLHADATQEAKQA